MSDITYTPLTPLQYTKLVRAAIADKVPAVVLGKTSYLINDNGSVSVLGQEQMTQEQLALFKTWLIKQYGHTI